ncbi:murein transglycosylase A [Pseudomonadota bacterium]
MKIIYKLYFIVFILFFLLQTNPVRASNIALKEVDFKNLNQWEKDNHIEALESFLKSCKKFYTFPDSKKVGKGGMKVDAENMKRICSFAENIYSFGFEDGLKAKEFFEQNFTPYKIFDKRKNSSDGLFTGYYEPLLRGSYKRSEIYKYPIYKKPNDLVGKEVYYTRKQIDNGVLEDRGLDLLYVNDKVDLFFLHIQGSGRVDLDNSEVVKIGFAARNNRPYTSIGKEMIKLGVISETSISAETIKDWLRNNPDKVDEILQKNESYIFFQKLENNKIIGAQGVELTPERSLAIDRDIIPLGFPVWIETKLPDFDEKIKYNRLLVSQDTGSAIKGSVRGDIFFGYGERAEKLAYNMKEIGEYFILLPKNKIKSNAKHKGNKRY